MSLMLSRDLSSYRMRKEVAMGHNPMQFRRWVGRALLSLCFLVTCGSPTAWGQALPVASQPARPAAIRSPAAVVQVAAAAGITIENNRLSINVQDHELQAVLQDIAAQGDIDVRHLDGLPSKRISMRLTGMPVVEGLKRLFRVAEIESYVLFTQAQGDSVRVQRILFFPAAESGSRTPGRTTVGRRAPSPFIPQPRGTDKDREASEESETGSVFDDIKTNTAARRLLSQLVHPNEQVRERALERLVRLVDEDDKRAELLEFLEPLMEDLASEDRAERDEARQEIRKLLRR